MTWSPGNSDQGSAVIDYRVSIAIQGSSFQEIESGILTTSYYFVGLTTGIIYEMKVEARNSVGYSELSDALTLTSAFIPAVPTSVQTAMDGSTVRVSWALSTDNSSPIT